MHMYDIEVAHVYVSTSLISPAAGEGLFAKKSITKGHLVCLFNGVRRTKEGRAAKAIGSQNEDWSDYRLTLGRLLKKRSTFYYYIN
jgi:hypothetical protein